MQVEYGSRGPIDSFNMFHAVPSLQRLELTCRLPPRIAAKLVSCPLPELQILTLSRAYIDDVVAAELAKGRWHKLHTLNVSQSSVDLAAVQQLAQADGISSGASK